MGHVILVLLKILGIVLLCIISIFILILLMALFVPVRYSFTSNNGNKIFVKGKVSFLLHILSASFILEDGQKKVHIKILGIPLSFFRRKQKKASALKQNENKVEKEHNEATNTKEEVNNKNTVLSEKEDVKDSNNKTEIKMIEENGKNPFLKIKAFFIRFFNKIKHFLKQVKQFYQNIRYYLDLFHQESTKELFRLCKKRFAFLFKSILPKKFKLQIQYGLEDPADTAKVLSLYSMVYPFVGDYILIRPDFENKCFSYEVNGKGRIIVGFVLYQVIRVYFNHNCRNFIAMLKKENNNER